MSEQDGFWNNEQDIAENTGQTLNSGQNLNPAQALNTEPAMNSGQAMDFGRAMNSGQDLNPEQSLNFGNEEMPAPAKPKADNSAYYQDHVAEFRAAAPGAQNGRYDYNPYQQPVQDYKSGSDGSVLRGFGLGLGIASILLTCVGLGILPAIVGIILSNIGSKRESTGVGTAGLVCSIIGTVLNAITLVIGILFASLLYGFFSAF